MTSQPGQQTITIHILSNILQSKSNQRMKPGRLIEYNRRNIIWATIYTYIYIHIFLRYWAIDVLDLFASLVATSKILKLTLSF